MQLVIVAALSMSIVGNVDTNVVKGSAKDLQQKKCLRREGR